MRTSALIGIATAAVAAIAVTATLLPRAHAESPVERGKYLVVLAGCNDCHTPGFFLGKPDMAKYLGGSDVGFEIPGLGVFPGRNITPDKDTGIGNWSTEQIATALTTGKRPDGRDTGANHALPLVLLSDERGCSGHCRLSPKHTAGQESGRRALRPGPKSIDLHVQNSTARRDRRGGAEVRRRQHCASRKHCSRLAQFERRFLQLRLARRGTRMLPASLRHHAGGRGFQIERRGKQRPRIIALRVFEQVGGGAGLHHLALPHHQQPAGQRGDHP